MLSCPVRSGGDGGGGRAAIVTMRAALPCAAGKVKSENRQAASTINTPAAPQFYHYSRTVQRNNNNKQ